METVQEVTVKAPKDKTVIRFENEFGFKEKSRVREAMLKYCWDVVYNEDKSVDFFFYDFPDTRYGPTYRALITYFETYLQNPDSKAIINIDHYKNEEDRPYKTLILTGDLLKVNPREAATQLSQGEVKHLKMTLTNTDIATVIHEYPVPVLTFTKKLKNFWSSIKTFLFPPRSKKLPNIEKVHLENTSYIACWTKHELENRVFDSEVANKLASEDLKDINDPEPRVKEFKLKAFKGL